MRRTVWAALLTVLLVLGAEARAQNVQRIAAIVNDDAISVYDLLARLRLVILTTNLPDNQQTRSTLAPQVLRSLIDEQLQLQEAARLSIGVDDSEVGTSIQRLEGQLGLPEGGVPQLLGEAKIPLTTLSNQIKSQLAWTKLVNLRLRPNVKIGDEEVENHIKSLRENIGKPQYRVGEIFLAIDTPANEVTVRDRARQLTGEIREGANFQALARQFSESSSAAAGGDIGWIRLDQLPLDLSQTVATLEPGRVSDPVRTNDGYHILMVAGQRNEKPREPIETVTIQQITLPFGVGATEADQEAQIELARTVGDVVSGCEDLESAGREMGARVSQQLPDLKITELSPTLAAAIGGLPVGRASPPIPQERDVAIAMICERSDDSGLPTRSEVIAELTNRKLNLLSRRYMRDLRSSAFVDVRV